MSEERDELTDLLIEAATIAYRDRDPDTGSVRPAPEFLDLDPVACDELFARQMASRLLERTIDAGGLSTTARAVLDRTFHVGQLPPRG